MILLSFKWSRQMASALPAWLASGQPVVWDHDCLQVCELEGELEGEIRRNAEAQRGACQLEWCIKELTYQVLGESSPCLSSWAPPWRNGLHQARNGLLALLHFFLHLHSPSAVDTDSPSRDPVLLAVGVGPFSELSGSQMWVAICN